jgi:hypothetical protein
VKRHFRDPLETIVGHDSLKGNTMNITKGMVDRFLCWKLPADFRPDGGVSFAPCHKTPSSPDWPVGTNLLTAAQAESMLVVAMNLTPDEGISPDWCATYPESAAAIINDLARRLDGMTPNWK